MTNPIFYISEDRFFEINVKDESFIKKAQAFGQEIKVKGKTLEALPPNYYKGQVP